MSKKFIYFPALSSGNSQGWLTKNLPINDKITCRFYDKQYKEIEDFYHPYFLISAGHNMKKDTFRKQMGLDDALVIGDSGGYQIATGALKFDNSLRDTIINWLENNSDIAMNLDIPPRINYDNRFKEALDLSKANFEYIYNNQQGKTKFLNVLQCRVVNSETEFWYDTVKHFDFNGWGVGGCRSIEEILYTIALFLHKKEFENEKRQYCHYLGISAIDLIFILMIIQKQMNKRYPHVQMTSDSSSPNLSTIFGAVYSNLSLRDMTLTNYHLSKKHISNDEANIPCVHNCIVCNDKKIKDLNNWEKEQAYMILTHHNLIALNKAYRFMDNLLDNHDELIEEMIPKDYYKIYLTIVEMFESTNPMGIYEKYKQLYNSVSNSKNIKVDGATTDTFFDFD